MESLSYHLSSEKIAAHPSESRDGSRLLHYSNGKCIDHHFSAIPELITPEYNLILNETKVVNARMILRKPTGGIIEVFCLEPASGEITLGLSQKGSVSWKCMIGKAKKWKEGKIYTATDYKGEELVFSAEKLNGDKGIFELLFEWNNKELSFAEVLDIFGKVPLPPYIDREVLESDVERYQTVFASNPGSVAAPTASLHFTKDILASISNKGSDLIKVSLHVGAGTFKPLSSTVEEHEMHSEMFEVNLSELKKIKEKEHHIAVGTTAVRTVESLFILANKLKNSTDEIDFTRPQIINQWDWKHQISSFENHREAFEFLIEELEKANCTKLFGYTSLMIIPGFSFRVISGLITNFHMPNSSLLLLISAFVGEKWRSIYEHALNNNYRFLSYGDSSFLEP